MLNTSINHLKRKKKIFLILYTVNLYIAVFNLMFTIFFLFLQNKNENTSRRDSNILSDRIPQHCPDGQGESESCEEGVKGSALLFSGPPIHHTSL